MRKVHELGTKIVGVTRGHKGAVFYDGERVYRQGIKKVDAIDTMAVSYTQLDVSKRQEEIPPMRSWGGLWSGFTMNT